MCQPDAANGLLPINIKITAIPAISCQVTGLPAMLSSVIEGKNPVPTLRWVAVAQKGSIMLAKSEA
jgi:hypothetical protein